jgi:TatD DNase family protein
MAKWIDIHAHFTMLEGPPEQMMALSEENGVERVICIGTCPEDNPQVLEIAEKLFPRVHCTLGIHPHDAKLMDAAAAEFIQDHSARPEVVALGEMGLDYYYSKSEHETQREVFKQQLSMAIDCQLPVQIHTRDAEEDTIKILKEFSGKVRGVIHCFTGTQWLAEQVLDLGLNISFSGIVTFKNAGDLREVLNNTPLDRLHVETDSPFLTPAPHRGKKNFPGMVIHTAQLVSEVKGLSLEELAVQTRTNAKTMFPKLQW